MAAVTAAERGLSSRYLYRFVLAMGRPMPVDKSSKQSEFHSDAWSRFERAVDVAAKSPAQHRTKGKKNPKKKTISKKKAT
jgi:hypothetical protein